MQISQESTCVGVFFNKVVGPRNCSFIKKRLQHRVFFCESFQLSNNTYFVEDLRTAGSKTPVHLFHRAPLGNCLFHLQVTEFQQPHTVKKYFTSAFQAFYTKRRSSYSKASMYLKSLKIIREEVNLY